MNTRLKSNYRTLITLIGVLVACALILPACTVLAPQETPTPEPETVIDAPPVINATGKVTPQQYSQLSVKTAGLVEEILVAEGDRVEAGDVLVRLQGAEDLTAAISVAQFELAEAEKALDDLNSAAEDAATQALQAIAQRERELRDARYQLDNFTPPQVQSKMTADEAIDWAKQRMDAAWAAFEPYRYYSESDDTREDRKEDYDDAQADYNAAIKRLEYETALQTAQTNLEEAREDFAIWSQGPDPKDVALAEAAIQTARTTLASTQAKLEDLELRAPFAGTVSDVAVRLGEWVQPGTPGQFVVMLADLENLQVETTDLNEIDAARVAVGDPVTVTFDALPGVTVNGTIQSISPKASEGSGVNYTAIIVLDEIPELLRWGMTAFVDIEVGD
jgi:multidrug efflux pump subunit AcrA (membrane-fusion protein)